MTTAPSEPRGPLPILRRWKELQPFLGITPGMIAVLVGSSVLAGVAEAGVLAIVVYIAAALSGTEASPTVDLGPVDLSGVELPVLMWSAVGLLVLRLALQGVATYVPARLSADVQARLRRDIFDSFRRASWSVQSQEKEGHLQQVLGVEVNNATRSVLSVASGMAAFFNFATLVVAALVLDAVAAGLVVLAALTLFVLLRPLSRRVRTASAEHAQASLRFANGVAESVRMAEETQTFGVGDVEGSRIGLLVDRLRRPFFRAQLLTRALAPLYQGMTFALLIGGLGALYLSEATNLATLGAVVLLLVRALSYSQNLQSVYHAFVEQMPYVELVKASADKYRAARLEDGGRELSAIDRIAFDRVSYWYVEGQSVLHELTFELDPGEAVGVVGPSGAGKSTLVQILLRLRVPGAGALLINGEPAEVFSRDDWFRRVAYLPQDARLVSGTVAENIRYHRSWVDETAIEAAARRAGIHDEIAGWSSGYDTPVGQRADAVSGGQRQRICLARALAGDPDLLVLDEHTSALDVDAERIVQDSLRRRRDGVTVVVIAHRMSTLTDCDRILVLDEGRLAALGAPAEVREANVFFRRGTSPGGSPALGAS